MMILLLVIATGQRGSRWHCRGLAEEITDVLLVIARDWTTTMSIQPSKK